MAKSPFESSFQRFSGSQKNALVAMANMIRELLPQATEEISYGMPTFRISGVDVAALDGFKNHNSLFPMSGSVVARLTQELANYKCSKGTIQFSIDKPMPKSLIRKIIQVRIEEINASYPKKNGEVKMFYPNGVLKAEGKMKNDELHSDWRWYRKDGSVMRAGTFVLGVQVGEWVTFDSNGKVVKRTHMKLPTVK